MAARDYERDRMEMIGKMKYEGFTTASDMAMKAFEDEKQRQLGIAGLLGQTGTQMGQAGVMSAQLADQAQALGLQDVSTYSNLEQVKWLDQSLLDAQLLQSKLNSPHLLRNLRLVLTYLLVNQQLQRRLRHSQHLQLGQTKAHNYSEPESRLLVLVVPTVIHFHTQGAVHNERRESQAVS